LKESIEKIVNKYAQLSNCEVDSKSINLQLLTHPDYPSIKSISDTYDYFGIENIVVNVPFDVLNQLPKNFIGLIDDKIHLINKYKNFVFITNENLKKSKISFDKLKESWNGIILAIEPKKENRNTKKIKNDYLFFGCLLLSSFLLSTIKYNINSLVYSITTFLGFLLSYFIVKETFGNNNKTINKFCEAISKKDGCSNVINNSKFRLFNLIPLSDACIVYFSSLLLFLTLVEFNSSLLFLVSLFSLPVIVYSLYYQALIIKDWCALCLGISAILIFQFVVLFHSFNHFIYDLTIFLKATFTVAFITILWLKIKNLLTNKLTLESTNIEFIKFKRNKLLFQELLSKNKLVDSDSLLSDDNRIFFGSKNPKLVIIAVTNPLCGFCTESFRIYYELLNKYEEIQINFVFSLFTNDKDNPAYKIINTFLELYNNKSKADAIQSLKNWYELKDFDIWMKKYDQVFNQNQFTESILKKHYDWLVKNNISNTPTTLINNNYYPNEYNIKDILYLIDDIILENKK